MTHTVHPYSHRLGVIRDWKSRWFARPNGTAGRGARDSYREFLRTDVAVREFLAKKLRNSYIDTIEIERSPNLYRIIVKSSRPGMIIGRQGEGSAKLKEEVLKLLRKIKAPVPKEFRLDIEEVKQPESRAAIAAQMVVEGLEKRMHFKRVIKQTLEKAMANKQVKGAKIQVSGRLGGADIARTEYVKKGQLPLQTLRADVDYALREAVLTYGTIGVKVWIYRGDIDEQV